MRFGAVNRCVGRSFEFSGRYDIPNDRNGPRLGSQNRDSYETLAARQGHAVSAARRARSRRRRDAGNGGQRRPLCITRPFWSSRRSTPGARLERSQELLHRSRRDQRQTMRLQQLPVLRPARPALHSSCYRINAKMQRAVRLACSRMCQRVVMKRWHCWYARCCKCRYQ